MAWSNLGAPVFLELLERWPSAQALAAATPQDVEDFARSRRDGWPARFADQVTEAMAEPRLPACPELLLGAPRYGRAKTPKDPDPGKAFSGGEIYLSMPGLGDRLAARVASEIGEHYEQYATPNALQCYAGRGPVTRRSGRSEFTSPSARPTTGTSARPSSNGRSAA